MSSQLSDRTWGTDVVQVDDALRGMASFRRLSAEDRARVAAVARLRTFTRGDTIFSEEDPSLDLFSVASGRVKVFKVMPSGKEVILEVFGEGEPLGAVAVYEERPFPASAVALEDTLCVVIPRAALFGLLERHPSLVRGLLTSLSLRLLELTRRLSELTGGRIESRLARLFLKLATDIGRPGPEGTFIPLALSRQELADMTGTTIETCIRIMSRWGKEGIVRTDRDGFTVVDRPGLETLGRD